MSQDNEKNERNKHKTEESEEPELLNHDDSARVHDAADTMFEALDSWLTAVGRVARGIIRHHGADTDGGSAEKTGKGAASGHAAV